MKALGIVRKVDELGRVVIPIEIRKRSNIGKNTPVGMFAKDDGLFIRKYQGSHRHEQKMQVLTALRDLKNHGEIHRQDIDNAIDYLEGTN